MQMVDEIQDEWADQLDGLEIGVRDWGRYNIDFVIEVLHIEIEIF